MEDDDFLILHALMAAEAWLDRWAVHVGNCRGGQQCTCGLTAVRYQASVAVMRAEYGADEDD